MINLLIILLDDQWMLTLFRGSWGGGGGGGGGAGRGEGGLSQQVRPSWHDYLFCPTYV